MSEARTLLVAGTASHVGKSTVAAGLCRLLADRGVDVAPYKAQNMSNNARAVADPDGETGEIGVSQYVQARAARVPATADMNPVLLKPRGDGESQLILRGEAVAHYSAGEYYEDHWTDALAAARESHARLAADHEAIVAEGAGSIAEPNLRERDLANVETARLADTDILLVADIERGGVFASLVGTIELMPEDLRERVVGAVITKFRGDRSLLEPGIEEFEERTEIPILGVVPYDDPGLPEEDSVSLPPVGERAVHGDDDGVPDERAVTVAVPRLPRASNMTDLEPLAREPGVRVAYLPLSASLDDADAVVLPGTKNTVDDLRALREAEFGEEIAAFDGPVVGLCGGYQLLGDRITNAGVESTDDLDAVEGFGLLPVATQFESDKRVEPVTRELRGVGPLAGAEGSVTGYEIHMGKTRLVGDAQRPFPGDGERDPDGAATDRVLGTYLHGLFENRVARDAFVEAVFAAVGRERPGRADGNGGNVTGGIDAAADRAAALLRDHVDLDALPFPQRGDGECP
ncbi:cobyric acid synthase CobQ [Halorientalis sp. IM1011]|uniref:cobyric acid synthase n=1 Tax=Halorientalis sp. IM1011 TaxID=1932360 RepID=UPI00097CC89F|nr:cobyric acid synthase [Halorientalis sp. IM1011]AQL42063.1 cobyric acid synthase CobQ [Halorientalis sp. IM1011]